jgi:glycosyltransferase involved in cell wall biosynthesis
VILPAFNESDNVRGSISSLSNLMSVTSIPYEIVLVDDGSVDGTRQMALGATSDPHVKVIGYRHNMGKGYALKYGMLFAKGDIVVFIDSDSEIDPITLNRYMDLSKNADIIIASKRHPESRVNQPIRRRVLSLGFHCVVSILTGINVSDTQTGLKVFRAESLQRILPLLSVKKYAFDVEVLTVARLLNMRIVEIPVNLNMDASFKLENIMRIIVDLMGIVYRLRIKRWYHKNINNSHARYKPFISW